MTADRLSGDIGTRLREARGRRGASLRQIADATKISVAVLEALEHNDISKLPGGIFSRAFVRSYAVEVGLDPDETIQAFIAQFPGDGVASAHSHAWPAEDNEALDSDRRMATAFLRLIAVSVPIGVVVLYLSTAGRSVRSAATPPVSEAPIEAPAPAPVSPAAPQPVSLPASEPVALPASGASAQAPPAAAEAPDAAVDPLRVGLTATRPCWVSAMADGQKAIERLLQAGEQHTIEVRHDLVLTAGDAGAMQLTLNGAAARPIGKAGEAATVRLNLSNFKDFLVTR